MENNVKYNNLPRTIRPTAMLLALFLAAITVGTHAEAQPGITFSSGSTGADGALNITAAGVTYLTPNATNIWNFTTITIAVGSTLKISEQKVHGPVYFLASGDVTINGTIDISGADSPGATLSAAEQIPPFPGSGGYSGGLGGIHGDTNHQAFAGNGPGGGAAGDFTGVATGYAAGGTFATNRFLVPMVGGSGGGGNNDSGQFGAPGGAGGGAILIASSTQIVFNNNAALIDAHGGSGGARGCGGSGGAIRLVSNTITATASFPSMNVAANGGTGCATGKNPTIGLIRMESNVLNYNLSRNTANSTLTSFPFALNLPTATPSTLTIASINGVAVNVNPVSFPDATINSPNSVPVVINATNVPVGATVNLYLLSDNSPNQVIPVVLTGTSASSTATVQVLFPTNGTRGYVKATWGTLGTSAVSPQFERKAQ